MNNKMLARIFAAVMAIAMLGTISFAASISGNEIIVGAPEGGYAKQTQKTVVAYYAATEDAVAPAAPEDIIAICQADNSAEMPETIKIDTTKDTTAERKYLIVRYGGSSEAATSYAIDLTTNSAEVEVAPSYDVEYENWIKRYTGVASFTKAITLEAGETVKSYGFKLWMEGGEDTSAEKPLYFTKDTELSSDGGEFTFGVVLLEVPTAKVTNLKAEAFYAKK